MNMKDYWTLHLDTN